jgi:hypothetical protein
MTDRQQLKRLNTEFERRLKLETDRSYAIPNLPQKRTLSPKQQSLEDQIQEFTLHSQQDHLLLAVTLVTLVPDDERGIAYGETEEFRSLWDKFLTQAFAAHLPKRKRHYIVSSVYHIHPSPTIHFHGIIAIPHELAHLVWKDGELKNAITRTLKSWRKNEKNTRPTKVRNVHVTRIANTQDQITQPYSHYGGEAVRDWLEYAAGKKPNSEIAKYLRTSKTLTTDSGNNGESLLLHSSSK